MKNMNIVALFVNIAVSRHVYLAATLAYTNASEDISGHRKAT